MFQQILWFHYSFQKRISSVQFFFSSISEHRHTSVISCCGLQKTRKFSKGVRQFVCFALHKTHISASFNKKATRHLYSMLFICVIGLRHYVIREKDADSTIKISKENKKEAWIVPLTNLQQICFKIIIHTFIT